MKRLWYYLVGRKAYMAVHPHWGPWYPSIRGTEEASKKTFKDWKSHEGHNWYIKKILVRYF